MVIRITRKSKPEETRIALDKLVNQRRKKKSKKLSEFYGKMKGVYGNGLQYQKRMRNEWS